jgi:hypothetical protein
MRLEFPGALFLLLCDPAYAFSGSWVKQVSTRPVTSQLHAAVGLGPDKTSKEEEKRELVAGVDYEVPDHESYRTSRRSKLDEQCDKWFGALLGTEEEQGVLGSLADDARKILLTPVPLVNDVSNNTRDSNLTIYYFVRLLLLRLSMIARS